MTNLSQTPLDENPTVLAGSFGSGKTEMALKLAMEDSSDDVVLVDLDLVTPYFRSREMHELLSDNDVTLLSPKDFPEGVELPVMPPAVAESMESADRCIVDVGGAEAGTRTLGALHRAVKRTDASCFMVLNPFRPDTSTIDGIKATAHKLESAGRMSFAGIIANPHLGEKTDFEHIKRGLDIVVDVADELEKTIVGVGISSHLSESEEYSELEQNLRRENMIPLIIHPHMKPQWY